MKDKISIEIKAAVRLPTYTIRKTSKKNNSLYYEFNILEKEIKSDEEYKEFELNCDYLVKKLDKELDIK